MTRQKTIEKIQLIRDKYFPNYLWPDEVYKNQIKRLVQEGIRIGHLGCGKDLTRVYEATSGTQVIGIDLDRNSLKEYKTGTRICATLENLPLKDNSFDLLISEFVLEHLKYPEKILQECRRVLKPKGKIIFLTVNKFSLSGFISFLTPHWFHQFIRRRMLDIQRHKEVFKTYYRINSAGKIRKVFRNCGFKEIKLSHLEAEITYLERLPLLFELGCILNKFIMNTKPLQRFQTFLMGIYEKQ